jgi:hypothetical protein
MVIVNKRVGILRQRVDLLLLSSDSAIKIFVLTEQSIYALRPIHTVLECSLTGCHPGLSLLTVSVKQLEFQALVEFSAAIHPGSAMGVICIYKPD